MIKTLTMLWLALLLVVAQPVYAREYLDSSEFQRHMEELSRPRYREVTMNVSAYTAHEGGSTGAWDNELSIGDCASDDLPIGTIVILPGGRRLTVNDRFGGGYKDRLDVYMGWDLGAAYGFGRQWITVRVEE